MTLPDDFDPARGTPDEWLLTNGLGGFAMGAAAGTHTRRYHGLLVAARRPPVQRVVAVHSLMEQVVRGDEVVALTRHLFGDDFEPHPQPAARLDHFDWQPPCAMTWVFRIDGLQIVKTARLEPRRHVLTVEYELSGAKSPPTFRVRPLTPLRDFHELSHRDEVPPTAEPDGTGIVVRHGDLALHMKADGAEWIADVQWWYDLSYPHEHRRGQSWREDVWSPGVFEWSGPAVGSRRLTLEFALAAPEPPATTSRAASAVVLDSARARLEAAAEQFVVQRISADDAWSTSVIAGYPWFADWGRDAMIAMRGLLLATGRVREALGVLRTFSSRLRDGLLVNRFDDYTDEPHYNTVDASLWFVIALWESARQARGENLADLVDAARAIVRAYRDGTEHGIRQCADGLITAGSADTQLTWMDAARDGVVFTPRHGKAVEINALWHAALRCLADLLDDEDQAAELREMAGFTAYSIQTKFWWSERACCHDVLMPPTARLKLADEEAPHRAGAGVDAETWVPDGRLRPNQVFAVSLPYSPLLREQQRSVVEVVREHLLTPYGLRTLEPAHPDYCGRYEGDLSARDAAYHNGTVWPWLIGPWCEALLRTGGFDEAARSEVREVLAPLLASLDDGCRGQIAEVYDGDAPHRPDGCPAQAWSVAEVLRVLHLIEKAGPE